MVSNSRRRKQIFRIRIPAGATRARLVAGLRRHPTHRELARYRAQRRQRARAASTSARGLGGRSPTKLPNGRAPPIDTQNA